MNIYVKEITMRLSLYFDTKRLESANFSRIVIAILVYAVLFAPQHSHITFLPQSHEWGSYP